MKQQYTQSPLTTTAVGLGGQSQSSQSQNVFSPPPPHPQLFKSLSLIQLQHTAAQVSVVWLDLQHRSTVLKFGFLHLQLSGTSADYQHGYRGELAIFARAVSQPAQDQLNYYFKGTLSLTLENGGGKIAVNLSLNFL